MYELLILLGTCILLLALWLLRQSFAGAGIPGCGSGSGCADVMASRWSRIGAIPVLAPGAILYSAILVLALLLHPRFGIDAPRVLRLILVGLTFLAGAGALWFIAIQLFVLHRFCLYCTLIHLGCLCMAGLVGYVLADGWRLFVTPRSFAEQLWVVGIPAGGLMVLIAGQLLLEPKLYALQSTKPKEAGDLSRSMAADTIPPSLLAQPSRSPGPSGLHTGRRLVLLDGRIEVDTAQWPMLGSPKAPHILVYLFDYTCPTCRKTHGLLLKAVADFGPRLSILMAPAPVDPSCNPHILKQTAMHAQACRYTRLGLLVWSLDPAKYEQFDHWIFAEEELPPLGIAVRRAKELMGVSDLDPAIPDPDLDRLIAQGVAMYKSAGSAKMPILLFPHAILTGLVPSSERLRAIFEEQFRCVSQPR